MTDTAYPRSMLPARVWQPLEEHKSVLAYDWQIVCSWQVSPPSPTSLFWYVGGCVDVNVDEGTIGEVRLVTAAGPETAVAKFHSYVAGTVVGWAYFQVNGPQLVHLQARVAVGTTNQAGGVHVLQAAMIVMSAPPGEWPAPGPTYPAGYDPNAVPFVVYPPSYSTPNPYG